MSSKHLTPREIKGLEKTGNSLLPGDRDLPSFKECQCASEVDRILDYMLPGDLADLKLLLMIMSWMPMLFVRFFLWNIEVLSEILPGTIGGVVRFARLGLRGLIMSLYYSHPDVHQILGYNVSVYVEDLRPQNSPATPSSILK
jgi:hypothetical protein